MKQIFTILSILFCFGGALFSQSVSFDISGGYCAPIASAFSTVSDKEFQTATYPHFYSTTQTVKSTSYGQGGNVALNFNWFSKKDIGCGLRANVLFSAPFSYTIDVTYLNGNNATYNFRDRPFSFQFIPHICFKHDFKVVTPVIEMGMLIGITHVNEDYTANYFSGDVEASTINSHGGALLGFYSSMGLQFKVSKAVKILLAVNCSVGSYSPTQWDRTSLSVNGQDLMSVLAPVDLHGVYVKQLDHTAAQPASQPHQDLKYSVPFSSIGFSAGIAFTFDKKKSAAMGKEGTKEKNDNVIHPF
ncbi:MAG: hypothetical protein JWO03_620 [Bacteroidetes bacterium]|nr:hypothetical protein [Bacteroidota bacterium]